MVVIGVDAHKRTHTCVAVDSTGRKLGEKTVPATTVGNAAALRWALLNFGPELTWGVEDVRNVSRRLEQELVKAGQRVVRVPTRLMARTRASARTRGKSDSIDATAVARAVLREPDLPVAQHDSVSRELQLLTERRETLVDQRTATVNCVQWRIHELDPVRASKLKPLIHAKHRGPVMAWLREEPGLVAELACDELDDIARLTQTIKALQKRIAEQVRMHATHLLTISGCGELTAATIVGETANVARFKSEAAFARYIGVAPLPDSSGATEGRVRFTRSGNRQLNKAVHRIAVTQIRMNGPGRTYYDKRRAAGDSAPAALRNLKRRICRVVFSRLHADERDRHKEEVHGLDQATADTPPQE
jgi:transposase